MFLHFVIDSFYSLSVAKLLRKMHPDNRHIFVMMQGSGSSDQYSILQELRVEVLTISPSDQTLYDRVNDAWLAQFERIFVHGLFHSGLTALLLQKVSTETFRKIYFIPYDGDVQLAIRFLDSGKFNTPNILALQKFINWVIPPGYRESRSSFFNSYDTSHCRFVELEPILSQPLQPLDLNEVEKFVKNKTSSKERRITTNIMIGHSCSRNDNHIEVLNLLRPLARENIRVILPMAYHLDDNYRQQVLNVGKPIFGCKLDIWRDYVDPNIYQEKLRQIDVAIFNLSESSGFGTLTHLLMLGCKIYCDEKQLKSLSMRSLLEAGLHAFSIERLKKNIHELLVPLSFQESLTNFKLSRDRYYSLKGLIETWNILASGSNHPEK